MSGWLRKAIGTPKQANKVLNDARGDVARGKGKDELAARRKQNNAKGGKR